MGQLRGTQRETLRPRSGRESPSRQRRRSGGDRRWRAAAARLARQPPRRRRRHCGVRRASVALPQWEWAAARPLRPPRPPRPPRPAPCQPVPLSRPQLRQHPRQPQRPPQRPRPRPRQCQRQRQRQHQRLRPRSALPLLRSRCGPPPHPSSLLRAPRLCIPPRRAPPPPPRRTAPPPPPSAPHLGRPNCSTSTSTSSSSTSTSSTNPWGRLQRGLPSPPRPRPCSERQQRWRPPHPRCLPPAPFCRGLGPSRGQLPHPNCSPPPRGLPRPRPPLQALRPWAKAAAPVPGPAQALSAAVSGLEATRGQQPRGRC